MPIALQLEQLPWAALIADTGGTVIAANQRFCELSGRPRPAIEGQRLHSLCQGDVRDLDLYLARCSRSHESFPGALLLERAEGPALHCRIDGCLLRSPAPRRRLLLSVRWHGDAVSPFSILNEKIDHLSREIARRMVSEAELRASERRLRLLADSVPALVSHVDTGCRYTFVNRRYADWFGERGRTAVGRTMAEVLGGDAWQAVRPHILRALQGHRAEFETWLPYIEGGPRYVEAKYIPHFSDDGSVRGLFVTVNDLTERRRHEEAQLLLAREVDHRAKNALTVVLAILRLTRARDHAAYVQKIDGRISALARTLSLLSTSGWSGASLTGIVTAELEPFASAGAFTVSGPELTVGSDSVQPLTMILHELATNALKYGALSALPGHVDVSWRWRSDSLEFRWRERGGPPVAAPPTSGVGTLMIDSVVTSELAGSLARAWDMDGLAVHLSIPARHFRATGGG